MSGNHTKHRKLLVRLKHVLAGEDSRTVITSLLAVDGVDDVEITGDQMNIYYLFPETTMDSILSIIDQVTGLARQKKLNRYKNTILAFMETNERDKLIYACGWRRYIEDIYMRHFDPGLNDRIDIRKQTWRKYK